jgi:hypothetical protein
MTIQRGFSAMTAVAFCRKRMRGVVSFSIGKWALGMSDRGGQDKANWRSRTRRPSAAEKCLSAHWFLETSRLAVNDMRSAPDGGFRVSRRISTN